MRLGFMSEAHLHHEIGLSQVRQAQRHTHKLLHFAGRADTRSSPHYGITTP